MLRAAVGIIPEACGSSGYRLATLTPLLHAIDGERILAAPVVAIDHRGGDFLAGRWVLAPCRGATPFHPEIIRALCDYAAQPVLLLDARPGFACYQPGESPTLTVRAACAQPVELTIKLSVRAGRKARTSAITRSIVSAPASPTPTIRHHHWP